MKRFISTYIESQKLPENTLEGLNGVMESERFAIVDNSVRGKVYYKMLNFKIQSILFSNLTFYQTGVMKKNTPYRRFFNHKYV